MRPSPLAATLLALGHRVGRTDGASSLVHRVALTLSACISVLAVWGMLGTAAAATEREARLQHRSPTVVTAGAAGAVGWFAETIDAYAGRQFSVLVIVPANDDAAPPPGLPRWPRPGEAFLSPALASADNGALRDRYGTFAGVISNDGLAEPTEQLVYYQPPQGRSGVDAEWMAPIAGFGNGGRAILINQVDDYPLIYIYMLLVVALCVPALVLVLVASRSGASRRDARMALLHAIGAARWKLSWILAGEAGAPVLLGVGIGGGLVLLSTVMDVTVPISGYVVRAQDLATIRWAILPTSALVFLGLLALVVVAHLRLRRRGGSTSPRQVTARVRFWPWLLLAAAVTLTWWGVSHGGDAGRIAYLVGMAGVLVSVPFVAAWIGGHLGVGIARLGNKRGMVSAIIGGRWLAGRPAIIARVTGVLIVGLGLASQLQVSESIITTPTGASAFIKDTVDLHVLTIASRHSDQDEQRFIQAVGAESTLWVYEIEPEVSTFGAATQTILAGPCAALATLGSLDSCPSHPVVFAKAYASATPAGAATVALYAQRHDELLVSSTMPSAGVKKRLLVVNDAGESGVNAIKRAAYRSIFAAWVETPGQSWLANKTHHDSDINWILGLGLIALGLLVCAGALAAGDTFITQSRDLGPLAAFRTDRRFYGSVGLWNLTVPLIVAGLCGSAASALLGKALIGMEGVGDLSIAFLGEGLLIAISAATLVGLAGGEAATRMARSWRPTAD